MVNMHHDTFSSLTTLTCITILTCAVAGRQVELYKGSTKIYLYTSGSLESVGEGEQLKTENEI